MFLNMFSIRLNKQNTSRAALQNSMSSSTEVQSPFDLFCCSQNKVLSKLEKLVQLESEKVSHDFALPKTPLFLNEIAVPLERMSTHNQKHVSTYMSDILCAIKNRKALNLPHLRFNKVYVKKHPKLNEVEVFLLDRNHSYVYSNAMGMKKLVKLNNFYFICDEKEMEKSLNENKFPSYLKISQFISLSRSNTKGLLKEETKKLFHECNPKILLKKRLKLLDSELKQEDFFPLKILDSHDLEKEIFISKHKGYDLVMVSDSLKFRSLEKMEHFFYEVLKEIFSKNVEYRENIYDIKLENILVTEDYKINLIDFLSVACTNHYIFQKKLYYQLKKQKTQELFLEFMKKNQKILLWNNVLTTGLILFCNIGNYEFEDFYKFIRAESLWRKLPFPDEKIREFQLFVEENEKNLENWFINDFLPTQIEGV